MTRTDRPTVLLVEDEEEIASVYAGWLADECEVRVAHDGGTGLELLDEDVDVVLLDRRLPDRPGREVLAEMEAADVDCPVAMVTGVEPTVDVVELGFEDYLVKPVAREELRETVDRLRRLTAYDERIQRQFAIASKLALLEARVDDEELTGSEEYARLQTEFAELTEELEQWQSELSNEDFATLFSMTA